MLTHPLTNFERQRYYQNEPKFNDVHSRNNVPKIKGGLINLDEFKPIRTHWIAWYVFAENVTNFDSFEVKQIPKEIRKFIGNKNITTNIRKNNFACLFSIHNTIRLSCHEQECLSGLCFERYFSNNRTTWMIMSRIFKGNMRTFMETIKLKGKKKLRNVTN